MNGMDREQILQFLSQHVKTDMLMEQRFIA